jgi:hypothetical protein
MLFVDAGNDHVNIKASADLGGVLNVGGTTVIQTSDNTDTLSLVSTDTDAGIGPNLNLYRNAGNGADADNLSTIAFAGNDDAGNATDFARITAQIDDASNGSEDVYFDFRTLVAGSERKRMSLVAAETVFNEDSVDLDFRVESNGDANCLFVDGNANSVLIGRNGSDGLNSKLQVEAVDSSSAISIHRASADSAGPGLYLSSSRGASLGDDTVVQDGDTLGSIAAFGADGTDRNSVAASISFQVDGTPGGNDMPGRITFSTTTDGGTTQSERMRINSNGTIGLHHSGSSTAQVKIENQNAAGGRIGLIVTNPSSSSAMNGFEVTSVRAGSSAYSFMLMRSNSASADTEFNVRGDGEVTADGSFSGGGADYAEYFEWNDGNSSDEDRVGYPVILNNNKIVKATDSDDASKIIGVISGNPAVVGDSDSERWKSKHLKDDYGRYVWEEYTSTEWTEAVEDGNDINHSYATDEIPDGITAPSDATVKTKDKDDNLLTRRKINPDWNKDTTYIPRENRKEWDTVGLMGKLRLRKGQPTGTNWIKMRDISDTVEEWLVR